MSVQRLNSSSSRNVFLDAPRGIHPDCTAVHRFAFTEAVGTTYTTIWDDGGTLYTFPASAIIMSAVSTSASDTMGLVITGLDADYKEISETVTLAGLTPVSTTKSFLRINYVQISTGSNVGEINVSNNGTVYGHISVGNGVQQSTVFSVPAGQSLYITQVDWTSGTIGANKYAFTRTYLKLFNGPTLRFFESTFVTSQLKYEPPVPFKIPEKSDFAIECKSSASTNEITCYINALLIDD